MGKLDSTTAQAMNLYARLQGVDTSKIQPEPEVEEDDIEIEVVDAVKEKKKAAKNKDNTSERAPRNLDVPELDTFKNLNRNLTISVQQNRHDIHYKEQIWGIPERDIIYNLHVLTNIKVCKDVAAMFKGYTQRDIDMAKKGLVRYIKVESYENIPYRSRELAYIKVMPKKEGGYASKVILRTGTMKENNIDSSRVRKQIEKMLPKLYMREGDNEQ